MKTNSMAPLKTNDCLLAPRSGGVGGLFYFQERNSAMVGSTAVAGERRTHHEHL